MFLSRAFGNTADVWVNSPRKKLDKFGSVFMERLSVYWLFVESFGWYGRCLICVCVFAGRLSRAVVYMADVSSVSVFAGRLSRALDDTADF